MEGFGKRLAYYGVLLPGVWRPPAVSHVHDWLYDVHDFDCGMTVAWTEMVEGLHDHRQKPEGALKEVLERVENKREGDAYNLHVLTSQACEAARLRDQRTSDDWTTHTSVFFGLALQE